MCIALETFLAGMKEKHKDALKTKTQLAANDQTHVKAINSRDHDSNIQCNNQMQNHRMYFVNLVLRNKNNTIPWKHKLTVPNGIYFFLPKISVFL